MRAQGKNNHHLHYKRGKKVRYKTKFKGVLIDPQKNVFNTPWYTPTRVPGKAKIIYVKVGEEVVFPLRTTPVGEPLQLGEDDKHVVTPWLDSEAVYWDVVLHGQARIAVWLGEDEKHVVAPRCTVDDCQPVYPGIMPMREISDYIGIALRIIEVGDDGKPIYEEE